MGLNFAGHLGRSCRCYREPIMDKGAVRLPAAERRCQLLEVALPIFARNGFEGTSMAEVAEGAGVTKPVLYQHFPSKRALYLELLEDVSRSLQDRVERATTTAAGPREQVQAGFRAYFEFVDQRREAFALLFLGSSRQDRELTAAVDRLEESMAASIAPLIQADLTNLERRQLAHALVGMAEVAGRRALTEADLLGPDGMPGMAARLADLAWAGLRGAAPLVS
jgi:AcrR family transcriptional regulator